MRLHSAQLRWWARHLAAVVLLFLAYRLLHRWYLYQHAWHLLWFAVFASAGFLSAGWAYWSPLPRRLLLRSIICLTLFLPWSEWGGHCGILSGQNYTERLFLQGIWLYSFLVLLSLIPSLREFLSEKLFRILRIGSWRGFPVIAAACVFVVGSFVGIFYLRITPIVKESLLDRFQAQIFSQFMKAAPLPPYPDFFLTSGLIQKDGKWFSNISSGFAALLAGASAVHLEWFLAPVLGAGAVFLWVLYIRKWYSASAAALFSILFLLSPWLVVSSSTILSAMAEIFVAIAILFSSRHIAEAQSPLRQRMVMLILLFCASLVALPVGGMGLLLFISPFFIALPRRPTALPILIAITAGFYFFNTPVTRSSILHALQLQNEELLSFNSWLTGWHVGFIVVLIAAFPKLALDRWDRFLLIACGLLLAFGIAFPSPNFSFGPHTLFLVAPVALLWIVRAAEKHQTLAALIVISVLVFVPKRFPEFLFHCQQLRSEAGLLQQEVLQLGGAKTLIFLDPQISQEYVAWNDPFLSSPVIYARDLGEKNRDLELSFRDYRPMYFRPAPEAQIAKKRDRPLGLFTEPEQLPAGHISFFAFALKLQENANPAEDIFDICYSSLFKTATAAQLQYLEGQLAVSTSATGYSASLRRALVHAGMMMLRPRLFFEQTGTISGFDTNAFLADYQATRSDFLSSGDLGRSMAPQFEKLERRMDKNGDHQLSATEIYDFLNCKIVRSKQAMRGLGSGRN